MLRSFRWEKLITDPDLKFKNGLGASLLIISDPNLSLSTVVLTFTLTKLGLMPSRDFLLCKRGLIQVDFFIPVAIYGSASCSRSSLGFQAQEMWIKFREGFHAQWVRIYWVQVLICKLSCVDLVHSFLKWLQANLNKISADGLLYPASYFLHLK